MGRRIALLQGHPSPDPTHLGHALADAYAGGAVAAGHEVRRIEIARLEFPLLRTAEDWNHGSLPPGLQDAQDAIGWAQHVVLVFPLWAGGMPAITRGFLEQVMRPSFAFRPVAGGPRMEAALKGRSARVLVTMGMPGFAYRWFYGAHGVRGIMRNLLGFCGLGPVRATYIGQVDARSFRAVRWIATMHELGRRAR